MKLVVCHHNGQIAEYPIDTVTGLSVEPAPGETLVGGGAELNEMLDALAKGKPLMPPKPAVKHVTVSGKAAK